MRRWRVEAILSLPRWFETANGKLPEQLVFRSTLPNPLVTTSDGVSFRLAAAPDHPMATTLHPDEPAQLLTFVDTPTPHEALAAVTAPMEALIDYLALQVQRPIPVRQLEFLDLTPPVASGDQREGLLFPSPGGYDFPKFQHSEHMGVWLTTLMAVDTPPLWDEQSTRASRDWYIKGLGARSDADRFMLFWIAMEILFDRSGVKVFETPKCVRGHPQPLQACPECGAENRAFVRGASIHQFLVNAAGVTPHDASSLWRLRQMFHGAAKFDADTLGRLSTMSVLMQSASLRLLKDRAGMDQALPPIIHPEGPSVGAMYLGIIREITASDL